MEIKLFKKAERVSFHYYSPASLIINFAATILSLKLKQKDLESNKTIGELEILKDTKDDNIEKPPSKTIKKIGVINKYDSKADINVETDDLIF